MDVVAAPRRDDDTPHLRQNTVTMGIPLRVVLLDLPTSSGLTTTITTVGQHRNSPHEIHQQPVQL
jgi:hypothetical protein